MFNVNKRNDQSSYRVDNELNVNSTCKVSFDYDAIIGTVPGAYGLADKAEFIEKETGSNVIIQWDKNTMKCMMELKRVAISFDVDNSIASLPGFRKNLYKSGKCTSEKFFDRMGFNNINFHCKVISGVNDNSNDTDILYSSNLMGPPGYMINNLSNNV